MAEQFAKWRGGEDFYILQKKLGEPYYQIQQNYFKRREQYASIISKVFRYNKEEILKSFSCQCFVTGEKWCKNCEDFWMKRKPYIDMRVL